VRELPEPNLQRARETMGGGGPVSNGRRGREGGLLCDLVCETLATSPPLPAQLVVSGLEAVRWRDCIHLVVFVGDADAPIVPGANIELHRGVTAGGHDSYSRTGGEGVAGRDGEGEVGDVEINGCVDALEGLCVCC